VNTVDQPTEAQELPIRSRLLERRSELSAIEGMVGAAAGAKGLLVIEGPPGIGKTSLIAEAKALGQAAGVQVLGARGSELERQFSYGVVRQLFEPFLAQLSAEERAEVLAGAAELASPLFDPAQMASEPAADSSLATLHGLYWLTANVAARGRLLLTIDDLHWCDLPSLRWLAYLLPRMEALGLLVIVGMRPQERVEDPALLGQIVSDPLATVVRPAPLSADAVTQLLRQSLSPEADDAFCVACWEETAGNPLLLRELVRVIADEGLSPAVANVPSLRELGARAGSRAVSLRLSRLPPEATALAQAVAVLGDDADPRHAAALAALDERSADEAAAALVRLDLLRPEPLLGFVHPLIRAAVYDGLTPVQRNSAHARAARLLADAGADPDRVAAHLLRSPPSSDSWVIGTLRGAASRVAARGAAESAVAYLRRALAEPPPAAARAELLFELASAEAPVDGPAAIEHLQAAHELTEDPIRRAQTALVLGRQLFLLRGEEADAVFHKALDELGGAEPELEHLLEVGLITNDLFSPSFHHAARERLERVRRRNADQTVGEKMLLVMLAYHDARAGGPRADAVALVRRALADGTLVRANVSGALFPACTVLAMADLDEALAVHETLLGEAHRRGSVFALAAVKTFRAQTLVWRGDLAEAEADAREALAGAAAWGASARFAGHASAFLADALMEQGRIDEATAVLDRPGLAAGLPDSARLLYLRDSAARLRILRGDLAGGLAELSDAGRGFEAVSSHNPAFIAWRSQAALALRQLGELDEARRLAGEELELARTWGAPRALGASLRAAGVVEGGGLGLELLGEAVQVLDGSPAKLEHAKARAELGAALRRSGQRVKAREHLRRAVELATICGASGLTEHAQRDLLATGARPRRIALSGVASLTPSERRVAEMAADGLMNREIAQTLFVTTRTVEVHLTSVYRKLAIGSRSELTNALSVTARA
jgi:DNA-binding CsgD family transcriptional regulator/tetratricopeptide (TPR) repeat protein